MKYLPAVALLAALLLLAYAGLWRGWRARRRRHADLPTLPPVPADPGPPIAAADGLYVGTTVAGDWLDRVVTHDLGGQGRAVMSVAPAGVTVSRVGATDVFVPAAALRAARLDRALAGKVVEGGGLVVLTWAHGDRLLDTAFRPDRGDDNAVLVSAVQHLVGAAP